MARLFQVARRTLRSSPTVETLTRRLQHFQSEAVSFNQRFGTWNARRYATGKIIKSPLESNVIRILRNEIEYQFEHAPPHKPMMEFKSFTVHDRPGEQFMTMRGRYGNNEDIKIEATMFDGFERVPRGGEDELQEDLRLHITLFIAVMKGDVGPELLILCSAWPDSLEVQKVYLLQHDKMLPRPYIGPDFRHLDGKVQNALHEFLEERGINSELCFFLHEYMMNKDRAELISWMENVKSFMER